MMKATMTLDMNSLWQSIKSLSASNKEWLRDKLIEDLDGGHAGVVSEDKVECISKEEILAGIDAGLKEVAKRKRAGRKAKTLDELIDEL